MTERDPNELYNALRDRLADYGQEPPAHLWAGIRQQLPPPVALPQHRPRRWAGRVLAGGLVSVACLSGWWYATQKDNSADAVAVYSAQTRASESAAGASSAAKTRTLASAQAGSPAGATSNEEATAPPAPLDLATASSASQARNASPAENQPTSTPGTVAPEAAGTASTSGRNAVASHSQAAIAANTPVKSSREESSDPATSPARLTRRRKAALLLVAGQASSRAARPSGSQATTSSGVASSNENPTVTARPAASEPNGMAVYPSRPNGATPAPALGLNPAAPTLAATNANAAGTEPAANVAAPSDALVAAAGLTTEEASLALRPAALAATAWPAPAVRLVADTFAHPILLPARRWALQVLVGPAVTYRSLGSNPTKEHSGTAFTNLDARSATTADLTQFERPALGFGAQVQLRRALNGRWALSTGLGYQEYAIAQSLRTVSPELASAPAQPPSVTNSVNVQPPTPSTTIRTRDTYRFLTLPVRLAYQLGPGRPRLRTGLVGGADLALYLGGRSIEGSNCACDAKTWGPTDSPYRPLSLSLSLGLEVRYRLGQRWDLLAQPTASYFLTQLARPGSSYYPRHLLGAGVQFGASYDLR